MGRPSSSSRYGVLFAFINAVDGTFFRLAKELCMCSRARTEIGIGTIKHIFVECPKCHT